MIELRPNLDSKEKVITIVGLLNGVTPSWAEHRDGLHVLVSAITGMPEADAKEAIRLAKEEGFIEYFEPSA